MIGEPLLILALAIFLCTYILLLALPKYRAYVAIAAAAVFVALGILPISRVPEVIDWNVLLMIAGTMGLVSLFIESGMPSLMADVLIDKVPNEKWAVVTLALFAGVISAFVDNVATVLMVAPVALNIAKKLNISPVPAVICISISSNLQGAATLVGDTTSILLGGYAGMDFLDFFWFRGKPGMFFVVEAGALVSTLVLLYMFRKNNTPVSCNERTVVTDFVPSLLLGGAVLLLICASFIPDKPAITNGIICTALFVVGLIRDAIKGEGFSSASRHLYEIDFFTLLLLLGLFVVIGGITEAGVVDEIAKLFVSVSGDNLFMIYTLVVWASVLLSAFIDNIPYVATMLPVVTGIASLLGVDPHLLYFGLLTGATLGGNLTPIGASANITSIGILRREGYKVTAGEFMKYGMPFTLAAVVTGYLLIWFIWA